MLILKLNAKSSTSVLLTDKVVLLNTLSSAPTVPSSTKTTSSVIGGSTLIALKLKTSTASMMTLLLSVMLPLGLKILMVLLVVPNLTTMLLLEMLLTTAILTTQKFLLLMLLTMPLLTMALTMLPLHLTMLLELKLNMLPPRLLLPKLPQTMVPLVMSFLLMTQDSYLPKFLP